MCALGMAGRDMNGVLSIEKIHKLPGDDYNNLNAAISQYLGELNFVPKRTRARARGPR